MQLTEQCPDANVLDRFVSGSLEPAGAVEVERHAARCGDCRSLLSALARTSVVAAEVDGSLGTGHADGSLGTGDARAADRAGSLLPGTAIGRYSVVGRLGAGGMGVVYAASDPELGRKVALKLLHADRLDLRAEGSLQERLLREAQSMARLSHPNVVTVHDVGRYDDQVFVAMELVDGETLRTWLEGERRGWREVVAVFVAAGRGLEAAHDAGILHRDFKPDNVLVGRDGRVRVMDFGLARAASMPASASDVVPVREPADSLRLTLTQTGAVLGTPHYMAPEQFLGDPTDARSDQFSFCVALWEALHGERPFEGESFEHLAANVVAGEMQEPPRGASVPGWLQRAAARGLAVEPGRRYPSMGALLAALDLGSRRRRWRWIAAAAALSLAGVAGVFASSRAPAASPQLCTGSEERFAGVWDDQRRAAVNRAFRATGVPYAADASRTVARALDEQRGRWVAMHAEACRATRVRGEQTEDMLRARMLCLEVRRKETLALVDLFTAADAGVVLTSATAAHRMGDLEACADMQALAAVLPPPSDPSTRARVDELESRRARALAHKDAGQFKRALELAREVSAAAAEIDYRPLQADAYLLRGQLEHRVGEGEAAEKSLLESVLAAEAGKHDRVAARAWIELAFLIGYERAEYDRGMELSRHAAAALERLGDDATIEGTLEKALGAIEAGQGRTAEATRHFERAVVLLERQLGPDHPAVATALDNLGMALLAEGDLDRALALHQRVLAARRRTLGQDHPTIARSLANLANVHHARGDYAEAEKYHRQAVALNERTMGPDSVEVATSLTDLGRTLRANGSYTEALEVGRRGLAVGEKAFGPDHPTVAAQLVNNGILLKSLGRHEEALAQLRRAEAIYARAFGPSHAEVAYTWLSIGDVWLARGRARQALAYYERALPILEKAHGPEHPKVAAALTSIGQALLEMGQPARALVPLERLNRFPAESASADDRGAWRFFLARALWEARRDRPRARSLAASARDEYARAGSGFREQVAEVDRWLARHSTR